MDYLLKYLTDSLDHLDAVTVLKDEFVKGWLEVFDRTRSFDKIKVHPMCARILLACKGNANLKLVMKKDGDTTKNNPKWLPS